jgi:phosphate transport system substrate-binding protein
VDIKKIGAPIALLTTAALALAGCAANETSQSSAAPAPGTGSAAGSAFSGTLTGAGSTAQQVAYDAWKAGFQTANTSATINYQPVGSGAGITAFTGGGADWAGSDAAIAADKLTGTYAKCVDGTKPLDIPTYIGPIAIAYNVSGVTKLNLNADVTAKIFSGKITKWNDPAIAALNAGTTLPSLAITAVHRSDDSGTTQNFTDYLHQVAPTVWTEKASKTWPTGVAGEAAKGTSGVVSAVKQGSGTIGYADESQTKGMAVANLGENGSYAAPSADAAAKIVEAAPQETGRDTNDLALTLDRKAAGYPAVLVSYSIVCSQYKDATMGAGVKAFIGYITSAAGQQAAVATAGNAPLSGALAAKVQTAVASIK